MFLVEKQTEQEFSQFAIPVDMYENFIVGAVRNTLDIRKFVLFITPIFHALMNEVRLTSYATNILCKYKVMFSYRKVVCTTKPSIIYIKFILHKINYVHEKLWKNTFTYNRTTIQNTFIFDVFQ